MSSTRIDLDVAVVGGGLAGLAAATTLARAGRRVALFERAGGLGGRAATQERSGFQLNLGPRALYRGGAGIAVLRELGIEPRGGIPGGNGFYVVDARGAHTAPAGLLSLLATGYMGLGAKLETARVLARVPKIDPAPLAGTSAAAWIERAARRPAVRDLLRMLVRVATYAADLGSLDAGAAVAQLKRALGDGVLYLDGGWQELVNGLRAAAVAAGVEIVESAPVAAVERDPASGAVRAVRLADGTARAAAAAVLAVAPGAAAALVEAGGPGAPSLRAFADAAIPVRAACLDVGLSRLPRPRARAAFATDRPLYYSVHSTWAKLAPEGGAATIHVMKYKGDPAGGPSDARADEREIEGFLDLLQPGWRAVAVERRFLPDMVVTHALPAAAIRGTEGRPSPAVPGAPGLYVAGDWVGAEGMLADAALASARGAARLILRAPARPATMAA